MAKVNGDKAFGYFQDRAEQRMTHWIKRLEGDVNKIKFELSKVRFWQFGKRKDLIKRLFASFLQIETIKAAILEIRLLR
jgi:hypothetical protein